MAGKDVNDYIEQGIYGPKETKPDEKRRFLGMYRERILLALTKEQVMEKGTYSEVEDVLQSHSDVVMVVNGKLGYTALSPYTKIASKYGVHAKRVTNMDNKTDIGLVLAKDYAVDKESIFIETKKEDQKTKTEKKPWWKRIFN
ncbi:YueI family protein [Alteribacillus sp. JSM 102045]|uniref:YueI family protein n=1 Tax=Alteribacillus sp. JSM 102045 TaxID=1562101 RepID=UPI0035BFF2E0